ncbi:unnamed protein product [Caenorhabditis angaria]|uniref:Ground-like domain-containing protein n=1 Tax=Caenorhabditis angaria TaxID=860376 RepID=A0A9P1IV62_9PELO|nr:unnamed protein product [Caenorhabditis angaria]
MLLIFIIISNFVIFSINCEKLDDSIIDGSLKDRNLTMGFAKKLNDSIYDSNLNSRMSNKAFLKTKLLENLNNFFPTADANEQLEILSAASPPNDDVFLNSVTESPYPTLMPDDPLLELELATAPSTKIRSEGRITSEKSSLDSIRDWRRRLYKAFKNRRKIKKSADPEIVEMSDPVPLVIDKNRQIIASRRQEPNWQFGSKSIQTYGRDQHGKLIPLFGLDPSFLNPTQKPIEPYEPRDIRLTYRSSHTGEPVVYIPAATRVGQTPQPMQSFPAPVASYLVTAMPQPIQLQVLPNFNTPAPPAPQQVQLIFPPATNNENDDEKFNNCMSCAASQTDEKCNSQRLRSIILNNIVANDAESSKKAVQSQAEAETGIFFDAICGTGFFSYIAHTDEFCLASSGGVNCYLFSPVCSNQEDLQRKNKKKMFVSRNRV